MTGDFFRYFCKDTLNIRNSQTFLVILEIYNQMLRVYQLNPVFIMWDCFLVRQKSSEKLWLFQNKAVTLHM